MEKLETLKSDSEIFPAVEAIPSNNSENLYLSDFLDIPNTAFLARAATFAETVRVYNAGQNAIWMRVLEGPADAEVCVAGESTTHREVMLGSNNYLGFANDPYVKQYIAQSIEKFGTGAGGPPLLNGTMSLHRELEKKLAAFKGAEDAMLFTSGYQANLGWVDSVLRKGDVLIYDDQSHASLYDAIAMTSARRRYGAFRFRHNDVQHLKTLLQLHAPKSTQAVVSVEGVYSMEGDLAPLPEIQKLCQEYGALLMVDDAHGTGVMGLGGRGTAEHFGLHEQPDIMMGTFSKVFGTVGGFITGKCNVIDYFRFFSRSYMFSAHLPPPVVATVLAGLELLEREPERIERLRKNVQYLLTGLRGLGIACDSQSAIIPILVPQHVSIRQLSLDFHKHGVFLNCIEHPVVRRGEERLRLSVMATHSRDQLDHVIAVFKALNERYQVWTH